MVSVFWPTVSLYNKKMTSSIICGNFIMTPTSKCNNSKGLTVAETLLVKGNLFCLADGQTNW